MTRRVPTYPAEEHAFTRMAVWEKSELYGKLSDVTRMLLEELQSLPEYGQLRLLADLKERRAKG